MPNGKSDPDLDHLAFDAKKTQIRFAHLGVFQPDGGGMRLLVFSRSLTTSVSRPSVLCIAWSDGRELYTNPRKACKNGASGDYPIHPELEELADILGTTFGLDQYQEQVMQIAQKLAGYSLGQADILRKATARSKKQVQNGSPGTGQRYSEGVD